MQTKHLCVLIHIWTKGRETGLSPPVKYFTDRSMEVLLLWTIYVISVLLLLCFRVRRFIYTLWSPAGKELTYWLSILMYNCEVSLSHLYLESGVLPDCIDSWYLPSHFEWMITLVILLLMIDLKLTFWPILLFCIYWGIWKIAVLWCTSRQRYLWCSNQCLESKRTFEIYKHLTIKWTWWNSSAFLEGTSWLFGISNFYIIQ